MSNGNSGGDIVVDSSLITIGGTDGLREILYLGMEEMAEISSGISHSGNSNNFIKGNCTHIIHLF